MRIPAAPLLAGCLLVAACAEPDAPPAAGSGGALLWSIEGPAGRGWLLGTMHVGDPRATALAPAAAAAFAACDALYTEIEGGLAAAGRVQQAGLLRPPQQLQELLPPELHRRLAGYLQARGLRMDEFERFRPWLATLMLGQLEAIELLKDGPPLDEALRARAREAGKMLGAIETIDEQIAALTVGTEEQQIRLLDVALTRLEEDLAAGRNRLRELFEIWLRGDEDGLARVQREEVDLTDPAQRLWWDALFTLRNERMAERADRILREPDAGAPLFAFGALHFVGAGSVVELLRARGWTVTRVR